MAATSFFIVVVGSKLQIPTFNGFRLLCVNLREHFKSSIVFHSASIILHLDLKSFFYTLLSSNLFEPQSWGRPKLIDHIHLLGQKRQNKCSKSPKINWTLNFQNPEIESDTLKNIVWSEHKNRLIILDVGRSHDPNGDMLVLAPYLMIYSIFLHPDGICILWSKRCTKCPWKISWKIRHRIHIGISYHINTNYSST